MNDKDDRNFVEKLMNEFPNFLPYPVSSLIIVSIIYVIFLLLFPELRNVIFDFNNNLKFNLLLLLIWFQLSSIPYLIDKIRESICDLDGYCLTCENYQNFLVKFKIRFMESKFFYVVIIMTLSPFVINDFIFQNNAFASFYIESNPILSYFRYAYGLLVPYFMLYLFSNILWIMINTHWVLSQIEMGAKENLVKIDLFNIERTGEQMPITNFVLLLTISYFICSSIIMCYYFTSPIQPLLVLSSIIIFSSFGACLLFAELRAINAIRQIVDMKVREEMNLLNGIYNKNHKKLVKIVSNEEYDYRDGELNWVASTLENLYREKERVLDSHKRELDVKAVATFVGSLFLTLLSIYLKLK